MTMSILEILAGPVMKILDKVIPDPQAKAQAQIELLRLNQAGEFKELDAQLEMARNQTAINVEEAKSTSLFVSGWRPAMGYCCVAIFAANYIGAPLLAWLSPVMHIPAPPRLDIGEVIPVLMGMLGLGSLRTVERVKGQA